MGATMGRQRGRFERNTTAGVAGNAAPQIITMWELYGSGMEQVVAMIVQAARARASA